MSELFGCTCGHHVCRFDTGQWFEIRATGRIVDGWLGVPTAETELIQVAGDPPPCTVAVKR